MNIITTDKTAQVDGGQYPTGWIDFPEGVDEVLGQLSHPVFGVTARSIQDTGIGKVVLLYKALEAQMGGRFPIHNQTIGDCVSHGFGSGVDVLKAVQILAGQREEFKAETATEPIYALSRVEVGGGRLGRGDGSLGAWAARAVNEYGTLLRQKYDGLDLSTYSGQRAQQLGMPRAGLPDELEPQAREHPVKTVSLVRSYEEARDAIANGYPVPVCSNQGFASRRDEEGFARPQGSWAHCMLLCGVDDDARRKGLLCVNSWGTTWIGGPKRHEQPDGSFWIDSEVVDRMLRGGDSFAMSGFVGFPSQDIDYTGL